MKLIIQLSAQMKRREFAETLLRMETLGKATNVARTQGFASRITKKRTGTKPVLYFGGDGGSRTRVLHGLIPLSTYVFRL